MHRPVATPTIADARSGRGGLRVRFYALVRLPSACDFADKFIESDDPKSSDLMLPQIRK